MRMASRVMLVAATIVGVVATSDWPSIERFSARS
jgi:hypothetical protein